eukprot:TRINITY_DN52580_c0_g1_i1.p1 TRINITY_DN52580_c0_g1~~TRINITY_DN52580_c0_g1_i1.p1  ORF type:complete len:106 (+),score=15.55 TRINITY_DN52580_c0_g1_i1:35-352(+)
MSLSAERDSIVALQEAGTLQASMSDFGRSCYGLFSGFDKDCFVKKATGSPTNLSEAAASCFAGEAACGANNCKAACLFSSTSPGCVDCVKENCHSELESCLGFSL